MVVYQYSFSFSLLPLMEFYRLLTFSSFIGLQPLDGIKREARINHFTPSSPDPLSPTPTVNKARAHSGHVAIRGSEFYYYIMFTISFTPLNSPPKDPCVTRWQQVRSSPHVEPPTDSTTAPNEAPSAAARAQNLLSWL